MQRERGLILPKKSLLLVTLIIYKECYPPYGFTNLKPALKFLQTCKLK